MFFSGRFVQKQASGFDHHIRMNLVPFQSSGVALLGKANFFAVDDQVVAVDRHLAFETTMHAVVLEHVSQVIGFQQVVDGNDFNVVEVLHRCTKHHSADAPKTVDAYFDRHDCSLFFQVSKIKRGLCLRTKGLALQYL